MTSNAYRRSEHLRALWPWLPLWTAAALLAIFSHGPTPLFSTRTLAVAWEMWNGHHWLVPYMNGEPYSEKAPLLFWMIHAGWAVFGVNDVWPRVLEVGFGGAQLVLISVIARRLFPDRPWVASATPWMLLSLSYAFLFGLQIMYDVPLATWALASLLCLIPYGHRTEPRWWLFGLCIGLGLLTKGPVMLLHMIFPWLLGPFWSDWARQHRARWYGFGALGVLLGLAMLLAWAVPAGFSGGEAYRQRLFFTQTAGRVVNGVAPAADLQNHARPVWWYLLAVPVLMFPLSAWPRAVAALAMLRRPLPVGMRFALSWLVPAFVTFSLVSGKQLYYPLPELGGACLLLAGALALLRERHPRLATTAWLGTWPLAVCGALLAVFMFVLPGLVAGNHLHGEWLDEAVGYSRYFSALFLLLGALLLLRGRGEMRRLAVAGLVGTLALNTLFTLTAWHKYDLTPSSQLLASMQAQHRAIGYFGSYDAQFHFAARLTDPITEMHVPAQVAAFAQAHPDGVIVTHPGRLTDEDRRYALLVQPFRSSWIVIWAAPSLVDVQAGQIPPEPATPTLVYPGTARP